MGIRHAFVSAKSDGADPTEVQPSHWNADHTGDPFWDTIITKAATDTVTASTTLVSDSELVFSTATNGIYRLDILIVYTGSTIGGDLKWALNASGGSLIGWLRYIGSDTTTDAINVSTGVRVNGASTPTATAGTDIVNRTILIEAMLRVTGPGVCRFQFAQNLATGTTSIMPGSMLRVKRIV